MKAYKISTSINRYLNKLNGDKTLFDLCSFESALQEIDKVGQMLERMTYKELKKHCMNLKKAAKDDNHENYNLPDIYAAVKEVIKRKLKVTPFEVQLIGAIALHQGKVIEMQTGEGKTLTAVLPAILNALTEKGVHILTYNDYLAKRDANWMRPVYEFFGLTVGFVVDGMKPKEKAPAYQADITYATAKEVGFDYLRDCMTYHPDELVMREFHFAIVDEADALLIDEARNPLVLAGEFGQSTLDHYEVAQFVSGMMSGIDFSLDEYSRNVYLTQRGIEKAEEYYGLKNLFEDANILIHSAINLALQARVLLHRDVDYIIKDSRILLVDELTGRVVEDRKWQNGLQTAVEAKEQLPIQSEGNILGSITIQHLMNLYPKLAGMTGTAQEAVEEFSNFYNLGVVVIPPNLPCIRRDLEDLIFSSKAAKLQALIAEIKAVHKLRRPILIGTFTVKESEELHLELSRLNLQSVVLNAKNDAVEANLVANAGKLDAITISTNLAGRGTDIMLGGKDVDERTQVVKLGGLHVIGTNRHESVRIDNQLRGRAGRQGDPGSSQFIVSLEDDLMVKYKLQELLPKKYRNVNQNSALVQRTFNSTIAQAQRIISAQMYEIRHTLYNYSSFIEIQRKIVINHRNEAFYNYLPENGSHKNKWQSVLREFILYQYDLHWAQHLDFVMQLRQGIYWERIGGQDPLRMFFEKTDIHFKQIMSSIDANLKTMAADPQNLNALDLKKPSSTWTYVVNDNPFQNQIGIFLSGSGNMGYQIDFFTVPVLFLIGFVKRLLRKNRLN
ncbi:preprotein translocase subunit SecA [Lunatibacter salilacus]|uniref:preprotein translocase subunit SecA n=1 Tax=Lunatibacter salilacus TaxID=2483804 RepID=UPI00131B218F|nr:DEAD/DEAH box helicase [Lunatibacter salilacus]